MRILVIGFLALISWSTFSTYVYVCKIRGFCYEQSPLVINTASPVKTAVNDSIPGPLVLDKISVPENLVIYFAFDKSDYTNDSMADKYFTLSNSYLQKNPKSKLSITGHTDAIGSENYNQNLGYMRAQTMKLYFVRKGIPVNKIIMASRGEKEPAAANNSISGRAKNRRTVITINN